MLDGGLTMGRYIYNWHVAFGIHYSLPRRQYGVHRRFIFRQRVCDTERVEYVGVCQWNYPRLGAVILTWTQHRLE